MTTIRQLVWAWVAAVLLSSAPAVRAAEPIKIGFSMELTGPFAVVGKTGLLAFKIWEDEVNAEGGLLGRPVKLVYYDDQSNPSLVPAIYTKLIDIDKVDLLISSYGTNLVVPAMPVAISHNRLFFGLFALAANDQFHYPKYFSMLPFGPEPVKTFAEGWFDLAAAQNPKPKTVAIVATDAEFQHKAAESAREHAKAKGIGIVYDRAYPPTTVDFTPIVRAVQAAQPDLVYISSYPSDTVGILRSVGELGLDTKMLGGGLAGLQAAAIKMQLGPAANGVVNTDLWEPVPTMQFPGVMDFIRKYQAKAPSEGVDLLGYFLPPFAYSELQILGDAIAATKTSRRRQARRIHALAPVPHDRGRHRLRARRRMDRGAADLGAVPRHQGTRCRAVPRGADRHDPRTAKVQDRRHDLSVHRGAKINPGCRGGAPAA